jgi:allantoin racemase
MRIWHQSLTVLDDVPHYRDALKRRVAAVSRQGTHVDLHGLQEGTYPGNYPGSHLRFVHLTALHKEQVIAAGLRADREGYDAVVIATLPDLGLEELRTLVDIPVVGLGQASTLITSTVGDKAGIVAFITDLEPLVRRTLDNYGLGQLVGPYVRIEAVFDDIMAAYDDPSDVIAAFEVAAALAVEQGANVIIPGEGPLNVFLADQGVSRYRDVPVIDSLAAAIGLAELLIDLRQRSGLMPSRQGFYFQKPPAGLVSEARAFYGRSDTSP